jgi:serine/threonine protein kinase
VEPLNSKDPKSIGGFTLVGRLGKGGMGVVYLASRKSESVALKVIRDSLIDDEAEATRFSREVSALEQISSSNVARIVHAGVEKGRAWFAAEFVNGPNLSELVNDKGPLDEDQWWELARGLLNGLADVHKTGVIHRDIKPANVIIAETGPKLIDFGIAHVSDATSVTATGLVAGSPAWFSPEQIEGLELTSATDVFSAGSVLTFAATGSSPWGGETTMTKASVFKILTSEPELSGLSPQQQSLVSLMLEKEPSGRPTAASLLKNLEAIWAGEEPKLLALSRGGKQPNLESSHPAVARKSGDATTTTKRAVLNQTVRASVALPTEDQSNREAVTEISERRVLTRGRLETGGSDSDGALDDAPPATVKVDGRGPARGWVPEFALIVVGGAAAVLALLFTASNPTPATLNPTPETGYTNSLPSYFDAVAEWDSAAMADGLVFAAPGSNAETYLSIQAIQQEAMATYEPTNSQVFFDSNGEVRICETGFDPTTEEDSTSCSGFSNFKFKGGKVSDFDVNGIPLAGRMTLGGAKEWAVDGSGSVTHRSSFDTSNKDLLIAVVVTSPNGSALPSEITYIRADGTSTPADFLSGQLEPQPGEPTPYNFYFLSESMGGTLVLSFAEGGERNTVQIPIEKPVP